MALLPLTQKSNDALVAARERAVSDQHPELLPQHLFRELLESAVGLRPVLEAAGVTPQAMQGLVEAAEAELAKLPKAVGGAEPQPGPAVRNLLESASEAGRKLGDRFLATDALLLAFASTETKKLLERFGADRKKLEAAIKELRAGAKV
ncbi:MAG TPA: Clp protease N-terminal domain-containing protein, partial [Holophagaceae bacterium]|nr:Clp protease N-terminal domain-containing protein [Holophagaceae bacterium]